MLFASLDKGRQCRVECWGTGGGTLQGLRWRTVAKGASQCGKLAPAELRQCRPAWQRNRPPPKSLQEPATKPPNTPPCTGGLFWRDAGASLRWDVVVGEVLEEGERGNSYPFIFAHSVERFFFLRLLLPSKRDILSLFLLIIYRKIREWFSRMGWCIM